MLERKNNKGQFTLSLTSLMVLIVAAIVIIFMVGYFISVNRYLISGVAIVIIGLMFLSSNTSKLDKNKTILILFILFAGVFLIIAPFLGIIQNATLTEGYFEAPFFGTLSCDEAQGAVKQSEPYAITSDTLIKCPVNSKDCTLLMDYEDTTFDLYTRRVKYQICDSTNGINCGNPNYYPSQNGGNSKKIDRVFLTTIPSDKSVRVTYERSFLPIWNEDTGPTKRNIILQYQPYVLWKIDALQGGRNVITDSADCKIPQYGEYWINRLISSEVTKTQNGSNVDIYNNGDIVNGQLEPGASFNYVSGTITRASEGNSITYNGQNAYCINNIQGTNKAGIYAISKLETASSIYNIVDLNKQITQVECCSGTSELNRVCEDNKWKQITVDSNGNTNVACSLTNQCPPGRIISGNPKETYEYSCENNLCKITNIEKVQCTKTSDCGSNEYCESSTFTCKVASSGTGGSGTDSAPQSASDCRWYEEFKTVEEYTPAWYEFYKSGKPAQNICRNWIAPYSVILIIALAFIGMIFVILKINTKKRRK